VFAIPIPPTNKEIDATLNKKPVMIAKIVPKLSKKNKTNY